MDNKLVCTFCDKSFVREVNYMKHKCEKMKRIALFSTPVGHLSYIIFNQWRRASKYPSVIVDTFIASKYYNTFYKFAEFSRYMKIPDNMGYIEFMVEKGLSPYFWDDSEVYQTFIKNFDEERTIDEKVNISIETLVELAKKYDCDVSDIFSNVGPIQVMQFINSRKLSPWLLLCSKKFMMMITYYSTKEQQILLNATINVVAWKGYFLKNPEKVTEIKNINRELGI